MNAHGPAGRPRPAGLAELVELPLPPFEVLAEQASLDGLGPEDLERFRRQAVPEPGPVLQQAVEFTHEERPNIPATLVCCSISGAQLMQFAEAGHPMFTEVTRLRHVDFIDLPTGHWPMWSRPDELARIIAAIAFR